MSAPADELSLLLLEDNAADAELVLAELRASGFAPVCTRVDSEREYLARLDPAPDLVIADYVLPDFDAPRALMALEERGLDIPVIVVTGAVDEETAVECMRHGAYDCLLKDRLARLGEAVRQALERKALRDEKHAAQEALRASEEHFRTLVYSIDDIVVTIDRELRCIGIFGRWLEDHAVDTGQFLDRTARETFGPQEAVAHENAARRALAGEPATFDFSTELAGRMRHFHQTFSPLRSSAGEITGAVGVAREITALREAEAETERSHRETIHRLAKAAEYRDDDTGRHVQRVSGNCAMIAGALGSDERHCDLLRLASSLHDVGKIGVPDSVLLKPGRLDERERAIIERHAEIGHAILSGSNAELLDLAASIALTHHERFDGAGYPRGLAGEEIPLAGRITAVADVFDALTSERVYRPSHPLAEALEIMRAERGRHFDPTLLDAFLRCVGDAEPQGDGGVATAAT